MDYLFSQKCYVGLKLAQLKYKGIKDASGAEYTETTLLQKISADGMTPQQHYERYGRQEGLNPNGFFNEKEYLEAKLKQLHSINELDKNGKAYTMETLKQAIANAGLLPVEHYERYGAFETDAKGNFINPSNAFDVNAYFQAKLLEVRQSGEAVEGKKGNDITMADVIEAFQDSNLSPISHYFLYGAGEVAASGIAFLQTAPASQRVANDLFRDNLGDAVPTNYNPATPAPSSVTTPKAAPKPADVCGLAPSSVSSPVKHPAHSAPVPGDADYVAPPYNIVDTNEHPVVAPTTQNTGNATDYWVIVNPDGSGTLIDQNGNVVGTLPPGSIHAGSDGLPVVPGVPVGDDNDGGDDAGGGDEPIEKAVDFTATDNADNVTFNSSTADKFRTHFGSEDVAEIQSIDFASVALAPGAVLEVDGVVVFTNDGNADLSDEELAAAVAASGSAPDGWTMEADGTKLVFTAEEAGVDKDLQKASYTSDPVAEEQSFDLTGVVLGVGESLMVNGVEAYVNDTGAELTGAELAAAVAGGTAPAGWTMEADGVKVVFISDEVGVDQPDIEATYSKEDTTEVQSVDFTNVVLAAGESLTVDGVELYANAGGAALSGATLAAAVAAGGSLAGWDISAEGAKVVFTSQAGGQDEETLEVAYVGGAAAEKQSVDLAGVVLADGESLTIDGVEAYVNNTGGELSGADLAADVAANGALSGWTIAADGAKAIFTFGTEGVDKDLLSVSYASGAVAEKQSVSLAHVTLAMGESLTSGETVLFTNETNAPLTEAALAAAIASGGSLSGWIITSDGAKLIFSSETEGVDQAKLPLAYSTPDVFEEQSIDLTNIALGAGESLKVDGVAVYTNNTAAAQSGATLAAAVAGGTAPVGWSMAADGASVVFTAFTAGDKADLAVAYSATDVAEQQSVDLANVVLAVGESLTIGASVVYANNNAAALTGADLATAIAADGSLTDWALSADGTNLILTSDNAGVDEGLLTATYGTPDVFEEQSMDLTDVALAVGESVKIDGVAVYTNTLATALSGADLAAAVAGGAAPDGWSMAADGANLVFTATTAGDKADLVATYTAKDVAEQQSLDLADITLAVGDVLQVGADVSFTNTGSESLTGAALAAAIAADVDLAGYDLLAVDTKVLFNSLTPGQNEDLLAVTLNTQPRTELQTVDLANVSLRIGQSLTINGEVVYTQGVIGGLLGGVLSGLDLVLAIVNSLTTPLLGLNITQDGTKLQISFDGIAGDAPLAIVQAGGTVLNTVTEVVKGSLALVESLEVLEIVQGADSGEVPIPLVETVKGAVADAAVSLVVLEVRQGSATADLPIASTEVVKGGEGAVQILFVTEDVNGASAGEKDLAVTEDVDGAPAGEQSVLVNVEVQGGPAGEEELVVTEDAKGAPAAADKPLVVTEEVESAPGSLSSSSLTNLDSIADFNYRTDKIIIPEAVSALVKGSVELSRVDASGFSAVAGDGAGQAGAGEAGLFKYGGDYYLFVNDAEAAFNSEADIVVKLTGLSDADAAAMTTAVFGTA